jgi:hypothetical protein
MLKFLYWRPFGVELELNSFDGNSILQKEVPEGLPYIANLVSKTLNTYVEVRGFGHTHWYKGHGYWVLKPDNSCGMEAASPIMQGWYGLKEICRVTEAFGNDPKIEADNRCSLHVHLDVSDLTNDQIGNILNWWIKCEPVFLDSVPMSRKDNRYCEFIGMWDWIDGEYCFPASEIIRILGETKYHTANSFHLFSGERSSLEFRIGEGGLCKDALSTKNWIRLLIHFVEVVKDIVPESLYWLDADDVIKLLGFEGALSLGMQQVRNWFFTRLTDNTSKGRPISNSFVVNDFKDSYRNRLYHKKYAS